jgi:hypothetical protein
MEMGILSGFHLFFYMLFFSMLFIF